jgi:hypothetical protein
MRYSILQLFCATTICALLCAALVRADPPFECLFFSVAQLAILTALLGAIGETGVQRAYWLGFFIASGAYLAFAHVADADGVVPRHNGPEFTTQLLRLAFNKLHDRSYATSFSRQPGGFFSVPSETEGIDPFGDSAAPFSGKLSLVIGSGQQIVSDGTSISFMRIGHSAWALLFGWVGGHFTRFIYVRSRRQQG